MPEIYVHAVKGRSLDQKRALIKDITDAVVKNFDVTADAVLVEIRTCTNGLLLHTRGDMKVIADRWRAIL